MPELRHPRFVPLTEGVEGVSPPKTPQAKQRRNSNGLHQLNLHKPEHPKREPPDPSLTSIENGERYYVISVTGFSASRGHPAGNSGPTTIYSILDNACNGREIYQSNPKSGLNCTDERNHAIQHCSELNADERDWEQGTGIYTEVDIAR